MRFILFVLLLAGVSGADDARSRYKQGNTYYALGKYAEAAVEYEKAYELHPDPALLYNAAQAQRMSGNKPRALLLYSNYLRLYQSAPNRVEVQRFINQLKTAIDSEKMATSTPPTSPEVISKELPGTTVTATADKPPPKKLKPWVWGVVGGAAALVVGVSLGVGLGVGLSGTRNPTPSLGSVSW